MNKIARFFLILSLIVVAIAVVTGVLFVKAKAWKEEDLQKQKIAISDSLIAENAQLRQLLESELESLCDTSTIEEKLAQAELDAFRQEMYREQETEELKAYQEKEAASLAAFQEKETKDLAAFDEYYTTRCRALRELEQEDPSAFNDYAIAVYKTDRCAYNYDDYQEMRELENNPTVAKYLVADRDAWQKREAEGGKLEITYKQQNLKIDQDYENRLQALEQFYQLKIAEKKESLGL